MRKATHPERASLEAAVQSGSTPKEPDSQSGQANQPPDRVADTTDAAGSVAERSVDLSKATPDELRAELGAVARRLIDSPNYAGRTDDLKTGSELLTAILERMGPNDVRAELRETADAPRESASYPGRELDEAWADLLRTKLLQGADWQSVDIARLSVEEARDRLTAVWDRLHEGVEYDGQEADVEHARELQAKLLSEADAGCLRAELHAARNREAVADDPAVKSAEQQWASLLAVAFFRRANTADLAAEAARLTREAPDDPWRTSVEHELRERRLVDGMADTALEELARWDTWSGSQADGERLRHLAEMVEKYAGVDGLAQFLDRLSKADHELHSNQLKHFSAAIGTDAAAAMAEKTKGRGIDVGPTPAIGSFFESFAADWASGKVNDNLETVRVVLVEKLADDIERLADAVEHAGAHPLEAAKQVVDAVRELPAEVVDTVLAIPDIPERLAKAWKRLEQADETGQVRQLAGGLYEIEKSILIDHAVAKIASRAVETLRRAGVRVPGLATPTRGAAAERSALESGPAARGPAERAAGESGGRIGGASRDLIRQGTPWTPAETARLSRYDGAFTDAQGIAGRTDGVKFMVRIAESGRKPSVWGNRLFDSYEEAVRHADDLAAQIRRDGIGATTKSMGIPERWEGRELPAREGAQGKSAWTGGDDNTLRRLQKGSGGESRPDSVQIDQVPSGTAYREGGIAPQPEAGTVHASIRPGEGGEEILQAGRAAATVPGGGHQVLLDPAVRPRLKRVAEQRVAPPTVGNPNRAVSGETGREPRAQGQHEQAGQPSEQELARRHKEVKAQVRAEQKRVNASRDAREARGEQRVLPEQRAAETKHLYNLRERDHVLGLQKTFPKQKFYEQVKIVGIRTADGKLWRAPRGEGRVADWLADDGKFVQLGDIKSPSTIKDSVAGGVERGGALGAFRSSSEIAKQHANEQRILDRANRLQSEGRGPMIVLRGRDPITGEPVERQVAPSQLLPSRVTTYGEMGSN